MSLCTVTYPSRTVAEPFRDGVRSPRHKTCGSKGLRKVPSRTVTYRYAFGNTIARAQARAHARS